MTSSEPLVHTGAFEFQPLAFSNSQAVIYRPLVQQYYVIRRFIFSCNLPLCLTMFSKIFARVTRRNFSTCSLLPSTLPQTVLKDYQYVKLIEDSSSTDAYNLLLHSHFNNVVLDVQTFNTVYQKTKQLDKSYHEVLLSVYNRYFRHSILIQPLLNRINNLSSNSENDATPEQSAQVVLPSSSKLSQRPSQKLNECSSPKINPVMEELLGVIKAAGESRSSIVLNNVEIEFDYKYLFGNPLVNEGIEEYEQSETASSFVDSNDVLSCMKSIKIGEVQFKTPESNVQA